MTTIIKKIKNKRTYYYAVQSGRVNGKPRIIWQKYLGTVDNIIEMAQGGPKEQFFDIFEAGGVAALLGIIQKIRLIEIIDEIVPKRSQGPSTGEYIALAIINRVLSPCSKLKMSDWYEGTVLLRLWKYPSDSFTSQRFWDHMDRISEEQIDLIQEKIALAVQQEFSIDPKLLLYDTTNFFTYIATRNRRNTIAQRGHNKQKRTDLRQVGLALLVTKDFHIPLFHRVYQGNIPDRGSFIQMASEIQDQQEKILHLGSDTTLVFDKGNISQEAMDKLIIGGQNFVCAIPENTPVGNEIFSTPVQQLLPVPGLPGTKAMSCNVTLWDKSLRAILTYSEGYFAARSADLTEQIQKSIKKLHDFSQDLLDPKTSARYKSEQHVLESAKAMVSDAYAKDVIKISVEKKDRIFQLYYETNQAVLYSLMEKKLGRTLIITSRFEWSEAEVISAYRGQNGLEGVFKLSKHQDFLHWQPAFHWTDQKIKVHGLYCVLALLITSLAHKTVSEKGIDLSVIEMLTELSQIREVACFSTEEKDARCKGTVSLSRMSALQKRLAEATDIGSILKPARGTTKKKISGNKKKA